MRREPQQQQGGNKKKKKKLGQWEILMSDSLANTDAGATLLGDGTDT